LPATGQAIRPIRVQHEQCRVSMSQLRNHTRPSWRVRRLLRRRGPLLLQQPQSGSVDRRAGVSELWSQVRRRPDTRARITTSLDARRARVGQPTGGDSFTEAGCRGASACASKPIAGRWRVVRRRRYSDYAIPCGPARRSYGRAVTRAPQGGGRGVDPFASGTASCGASRCGLSLQARVVPHLPDRACIWRMVRLTHWRKLVTHRHESRRWSSVRRARAAIRDSPQCKPPAKHARTAQGVGGGGV
jgi:hypothetical protein